MISFNPSNMRTFKITIHGPDKEGKNTSRQISLRAGDVDEVANAVRDALLETERKQVERNAKL